VRPTLPARSEEGWGTRLLTLPSLGPRRLLLFLQVLLLLLVSLLQLLRLLLVPLFYLLPLRFRHVPLRQTLMLLLLFLLQLLVVLFLLLVQLGLLLLVFLVQFRVAGVWRGRTLVRLKVLSMVWDLRPWNIVLRASLRPIAPVLRTGNIVPCAARLNSAALGWRMVWRSGFSGRHRSRTSELPRPVGSGYGWPAMVNRSPLLRVAAGSLLMLPLNRRGCEVSVVFSLYFFSSGAVIDPAVAAVVADPIRGVVVDYRGVVNVMNVGDVHVVDGAVVEKVVAIPAATFVAVAKVAESVIDTTVSPSSMSVSK